MVVALPNQPAAEDISPNFLVSSQGNPASGGVKTYFVSENRASGSDSSYAVDYRASESIRDLESEYSEAKINTANI